MATAPDDLAVALAHVTLQERRWAKGKHAVGLLAAVLVVALEAALLSPLIARVVHAPSGPVIGVVHLEGEMLANSEGGAASVIPALQAAFADPDVKEVVLYINSPGGAPAEAERISAYLSRRSEETGKPTTAVIGSLGASAAYLASLGAGKVVAGRYSLVGSIGAIIQGWDVSRVLEKVEVRPQVYASGHLKSMLNPYLPPTPAAAEKAQALAAQAGRLFLEDVVARRGNRLTTRDIASGEVWDGPTALSMGLVDDLATLEDVAAARKLAMKDFGPKEKSPFSALGALASSVSERVSGVSSSAAGEPLR